MNSDGSFDRRLRISGILVIAGLAVEAVSLFWAHPTAFLLFTVLGVLLIGAGILLYLYSLASLKSWNS